jgi:hypothetical protein
MLAHEGSGIASASKDGPLPAVETRLGAVSAVRRTGGLLSLTALRTWERYIMRQLLCGLLLAGVAGLAPPPLGLAGDPAPEPGFTPLFNGKDLTGWKTKKGNESLDGQKEAYKGRFKVAEGKLVIDPKVKGDVVIQTAKTLGPDAHIKFEFLPGPGCNNDLFFRGHKFDLVKGNVKNLKEGEWNQFEIISRGGEVEFRNNGQTQRKAKVKVASSPLGIRAEYGPIQFRRLRVKTTP